MITIAQQVQQQYGEKISSLSTHALYHLLRQEYPDGRPATYANFGGKRVFDAVHALVHDELVKRGIELPMVSAFFLVCDH